MTQAVSAGASAGEGLLDGLHTEIAGYYSQKVLTHGPTPLGVDWPCVPTQELRFVQLLRLCDFAHPFALNDLGCGYGALLAYLARRHRRSRIDYLGIDLSPEMLVEASQLWAKRSETGFVLGHTSPRVADYSVASGIFNVKLHQPTEIWTSFIETTLTNMHATSRRGFAVNFLAPLAAGVEGKTELYRCPASVWRQFCEEQLAARVDVLENYGLREYTLLVRSA
ncbi:MAG: class I SAM-dependent methyltransferase [Pseudomonadota bacterium]